MRWALGPWCEMWRRGCITAGVWMWHRHLADGLEVVTGGTPVPPGGGGRGAGRRVGDAAPYLAVCRWMAAAMMGWAQSGALERSAGEVIFPRCI